MAPETAFKELNEGQFEEQGSPKENEARMRIEMNRCT